MADIERVDVTDTEHVDVTDIAHVDVTDKSSVSFPLLATPTQRADPRRWKSPRRTRLCLITRRF